MSENCIDAARIGEIADTPADHPWRQHARECPRCRNLLSEYLAFMDAGPVPEAGLDEARASLDATIRTRAAQWAPASARTLRRMQLPWWRGVSRPAQLVAAMMLLVAVAVVWIHRNPEAPVLRGGSSQSASFSPGSARVDADGTIHLSWGAVDGADAYEVCLYGPDLAEVYRHPAVSALDVVIDGAELAGRVPAGSELTWRVRALARGDLLQISTPGSVRLR